MEKVLITGVNGFVGEHLVRQLISSGTFRLFGLVRSDAEKFKNLGSREIEKIELRTCDIVDFPRLSELLADIVPDRVFHLAGQAFVPQSFKDPIETFRTNVLGTVSLLESIKLTLENTGVNPAVLIPSSDEVYGGGTPPFSESSPINPKSPYAASKASQELVGIQYFNSFGLKVIETRSFNHIGPGQDEQFAVSNFAKQLAEITLEKREPVLRVGNLEAKRDFTDVRDVVNAYVILTEKGMPGAIYNVCSGKAISMKEIVERLIRISCEEISLEKSQSRLRPSDIPIMVGDNSKISRTTDWKPQIPLDKSLEDALAYWVKRLKEANPN